MRVSFTNVGDPLPVHLGTIEVEGSERSTDLAKQITVALKGAICHNGGPPESSRPTSLEAKSIAFVPLAVV